MSHDLVTPAASSVVDPRVRTLSTAALVVLLIALVARLVFALWERYDGTVSYDELVAFGDAYWPMNVLVFGPSYAIGFAVQALLAWHLGRGRARVVTWVGAGLVLIGGTVFALAATAHALPYDWVADRNVLDEQTGRGVVDAFRIAGTDQLLPYILASQALIAVGAVAIVVGARIGGTVPTWLLVVTVLLVVVFAVAPAEPGSVLAMLIASAQAAVWALIGWFGWRATRR